MSMMIAPRFISIKKDALASRQPWPALAQAPHFQGLSNAGKADEPKPSASQKPHYETPQPRPWAMGLLTLLNDYLVFDGVPGLRSVPLINRIPGVRGFTGVTRVDMPEADLARLKKSVTADTVAFIGPNHPEFFHDWVIDKRLSSTAAPTLACWADAGIVNGSAATRRFMLANHIIANNGKEKAREDSVKAALAGHGVLLHPEGRVWWHGDKVHPLFPGLAEMAMEAAKRPEGKGKPVYIVPVAWKFAFHQDVSAGLQRDMVDIEKKLGLSIPPNLPVGQHFFQLQEAMLTHQEKKFSFPAVLQALHQDKPYFQRQRQFQDFLINQMEQKFGQQDGHTAGMKQAGLERAVARAARENPHQVTKEDRAVLKELFRLEGFSPELYNRPYLTQEHLHENIKRSMQSFFGGLKTMIPQPAGPRTAHIRVAEPIRVRDHMGTNLFSEAERKVRDRLLQEVRDGLQHKLDDINEEIEPSVNRFQVKNEFYVPQPFMQKSRL